MALTTMAAIKAALRPEERFFKVGLANSANYPGGWSTFWDRGGMPLAGTKDLNANLVGPNAAGIPFTNPVSGDAFLASLKVWPPGNAMNSGCIMLCDRLWESASLSATVLTSQAITSGPWPARDENGSTNGENVFLCAEITTTTVGGSTDLVYTASYTNSGGTGGRTAGTAFAPSARNASGCYLLGLAGVDSGVQSVQAFQITGTTAHSAGAINLVAYRPIAYLGMRAGQLSVHDPLTGGLPIIYPDSVLYLMGITGESNSGYPGNPSGSMQCAWG